MVGVTQENIKSEVTGSTPEVDRLKAEIDRLKEEIIESNKQIVHLKADFRVTNGLLSNTQKLLSKTSEENAQLSAKLEHTKTCAELSEFLLYLKEQIFMFETHYCAMNFPSEDSFVASVQKIEPAIEISDITEGVHFRKWLWFMVAGGDHLCMGLSDIRSALNNDPKQYVWFATQMETLFSVLSDDVRGISPLQIRHMTKVNFPNYVTIFNKNVRVAVTYFWDYLINLD